MSQAKLMRVARDADNGTSQLLLEGYAQCNLSNSQVSDASGPKWEVRNGAKLLIDGKPAR